ncbi:MAG: LemA family protein, partial [Cyclobacteriaceae bacterium]
IIHELKVTHEIDQDVLNKLDYRIDQLLRIRYTQKTMTNTDVVDEYDFASNSLVAEIIALTESHPAYAYNSVLQQLLEVVRQTDQRIETHRIHYDGAAQAYNQFIEVNRKYLHEIDQSLTPEKKPLFYIVSE